MSSVTSPMTSQNTSQMVLPAGCEEKCRGCRHRGWSVQESESQKQKFLQSQLNEWSEQFEPIKGPEPAQRWGYRSKTCFHTLWKEDRWAFGLLARDELIEIPNCPVHVPWISSLVGLLSVSLPSYETFPLTHFVVAGTLITFVLKTKPSEVEIPKIDWASFGITGVFFNFNPAAGHRVFAARGWKLIWGKPFGVDLTSLHPFHYGPDSFQQLIPSLHQAALQRVKQFFNPQPEDGVIDLYSGVGYSMHQWRQSGCSFIGVELGGSAWESANKNVSPESCLRGRASERLPQLDLWIEKTQPRSLSVYVNPPRIGLESEVVNWIGSSAKPDRVAYLSCSAGTLSRDLKSLCSRGFEVQRMIPYDFFPQTQHVETLVLLKKFH